MRREVRAQLHRTPDPHSPQTGKRVLHPSRRRRREGLLLSRRIQKTDSGTAYRRDPVLPRASRARSQNARGSARLSDETRRDQPRTGRHRRRFQRVRRRGGGRKAHADARPLRSEHGGAADVSRRESEAAPGFCFMFQIHPRGAFQCAGRGVFRSSTDRVRF